MAPWLSQKLVALVLEGGLARGLSPETPRDGATSKMENRGLGLLHSLLS